MTDMKFSRAHVTLRKIDGVTHELTPAEIPLRYDLSVDELYYATKNDYDLNEATLGIFMVTFWLVKDLVARRDTQQAREVQKQLITLRETLR